jgi:hypothetical protein
LTAVAGSRSSLAPTPRYTPPHVPHAHRGHPRPRDRR